nr:Crp/Fnr family transcriptional regulator [Shewanella sp. Isolate11]
MIDFLTQLGLNQDALGVVRENAKRLHGVAGDILLHQGQVQQYGYFIQSGILKACHYADKGTSLVKEYYFEGEWCFLYGSWLTQEPAQYQMEVLQAAQLIRLPLSLLDRPEWLQVKLVLISQQLIYKEQKEAFFLLNTPEQRYRYLLEHRANWLTQLNSLQVASYIGISPVSLSRLKARIGSN